MFDLKLTSKNPDLLLTWLSTADGPTGIRQTLRSSAYNGSSWSAPELLLEDAHVTDYDVAGNGAGAAVAAVTTGSNELIYSVSTSPWTAPIVLTNSAGGGPVSIAFAGTNNLAAVWQDIDGSTHFSSYDLAQDLWSHAGVVIPETLTDELGLLKLSDSTTTALLVAWVEGGASGSLHHAFLDPTGQVLMERRVINLAEVGHFRQLQLRPIADLQAGILALLEDGQNHTLREYRVGLPGVDDCDGDGVSDAEEIAMGTATDLNGNGIPDDCELA